MPIALDPNQTFKYVLKSDREKENPPTFEFRYLTGRQWRQYAEFFDRLPECQSGTEASQKIFDQVRDALRGWSSMSDIAYDPDKLEDITTLDEAKELIEGIMRGGKPEEEDLGK